jgi:hypothetical protein
VDYDITRTENQLRHVFQLAVDDEAPDRWVSYCDDPDGSRASGSSATGYP